MVGRGNCPAELTNQLAQPSSPRPAPPLQRSMPSAAPCCSASSARAAAISLHGAPRLRVLSLGHALSDRAGAELVRALGSSTASRSLGRRQLENNVLGAAGQQAIREELGQVGHQVEAVGSKLGHQMDDKRRFGTGLPIIPITPRKPNPAPCQFCPTPPANGFMIC